MSEQQILDCNTWSSGCQGGTQRQLSLERSCDRTSVEDGGAMMSRRSCWVDVSSRDRPTLTASVEEGCEIHKPNFLNQSRQQQPPHKETRKQELALWWLTILPGWVGPNPQHTRDHFVGEAVGCSLALQHTTMSQRKRNTITTLAITVTIRAQTNSNDFGEVLELADSNSIFVFLF